MKKLIISMLILSSPLFAQHGFDQGPAPGNYVLSRTGWVAPVSSTGGLTNFGWGALPDFMTGTTDNPTTTPVGNLAFSLSIFNTDYSAYKGSVLSQGTLQATSFSGADMGAQIAAALDAIYADGGGTVDARGFACPTSCHIGTANLQVGDFTHAVTLILPTGTITRDTISGTGKSAQILYASKATIIGQGRKATIISGPSDVVAVQQANNSGSGVDSPTLKDFSITDTGTVNAGVAAFQISGPNEDASRGDDVTNGLFEDMNVSGADIGTLYDSQHGCVCYNHTVNVNSGGHSIGIKTMNDSGFGFGVNSNQIIQPVAHGPIGIFDAGGITNLIVQPDMELNASNNGGGVLAAQVYVAGSGYTVNDVLTPSTGCTIEPTLRIDNLPGTQGHPVFTVLTPGSGCPTSETNIATTGGTGTGLTVNMETSGYMILLVSGTMVMNPYEEAGAPDYICGVGNMVLGAYFSSNGANYIPTYCPNVPGSDTRYTSVESNMIFGTGMQPKWLSTAEGIIFGTNYTYNPGNTFTKPNLQGGGSNPTGTCSPGDSYINTTTGVIFHCSGTAWVNNY